MFEGTNSSNPVEEARRYSQRFCDDQPWLQSWYNTSRSKDAVKFLSERGLGPYLKKLDYSPCYDLDHTVGGYTGDLSSVEAMSKYLLKGMCKIDGNEPLDNIRRFAPRHLSHVFKAYIEDSYIDYGEVIEVLIYFHSCLVFMWGLYRQSLVRSTGLYDYFERDTKNLCGDEEAIKEWHKAYRVLFKRDAKPGECPLLPVIPAAIEERERYFKLYRSDPLKARSFHFKYRFIKEFDIHWKVKDIKKFFEPYIDIENYLGSGYTPPLYDVDEYERLKNTKEGMDILFKRGELSSVEYKKLNDFKGQFDSKRFEYLCERNLAREKIYNKWIKNPSGFLSYLKLTYERTDENYKYIDDALSFVICSDSRWSLLVCLEKFVEYYFTFDSGGREKYQEFLAHQNFALASDVISRQMSFNEKLGYGPLSTREREELIYEYRQSEKVFLNDYHGSFFKKVKARWFRWLNGEDYLKYAGRR